MPSNTITWIGVTGGNWDTASNWNPAHVPSTAPGYNDVSIPAGITIALTSAVSISNLEISGTGLVSFTGSYRFEVNSLALSAGQGIDIASGGNFTADGNSLTGQGIFTFGGGPFNFASQPLSLSSGQTVDLTGGATLSSSDGLTLSGSPGTFTLEGGAYTVAGNGVSIASGQTLVLQETTYTTTSAVNGPGTVELSGSTLSATGTAVSANVKFDTVTGESGNTLITSYTTALNLTNLGYGDKIVYPTGSFASGDSVQFQEKGTSGIYNIVMVVNPYYSFTIGQATLAPGTIGADFTYNYADETISYGGSAPPCFMQGTLIATPDGEIAVEQIVPGTELLLANGETRAVRWVGHSVVAPRFADPLVYLPIRIKAGAIGENMPVRDLLVSPEHAVFIDGVLVQAGALVNGSSIIREEMVPERFTYYHIELDSHELLLAEGMPAESFVDNVSRIRFHNWDRRHGVETPIVEMDYPRAKSHRQVPMSMRRAISARAGALQARILAA